MSILKKMSMHLKGKVEGSKYDVNKEQAAELLGDDSVKVLDVRTQKEIDKVEPLVEDAILIDFHRSDFKDELSKLDRESTYLVV